MLPFPFSAVDNHFEDPWQLFQVQSLWLLLGGAALLWGARAADARRRGRVAAAALIVLGVAFVLMPIDPGFARMGESSAHAASRGNFEGYFGHAVRYEKHLSQFILLRVYEGDTGDAAPARALAALSRLGAVWFLACALAIGVLERWSPVVLRYLGLVLLAPAALLYFGWREFGYLSLNVAAFPLLARGLRDGSPRLEAGAAVTGLGAALHGSGLVALAGAGLAALGAPAAWRARLACALRIGAWGVAAYLGWIAIYVIVYKLPIAVGDPEAAPWRTWLADEVRDGRLRTAIFSAFGARDLAMSAWIVGAPLLLVAASLRRQFPQEWRLALLYAVPSVLFLIFRWPLQGVGGGLDLVVAGFPAVFALAWLCAHDQRRTLIAAALLASAHVAFWRVALDTRFDSGWLG